MSVSKSAQKVWIFNGRRSNQAYVRNTKQHIVNVDKMHLETLWYNKCTGASTIN